MGYLALHQLLARNWSALGCVGWLPYSWKTNIVHFIKEHLAVVRELKRSVNGFCYWTFSCCFEREAASKNVNDVVFSDLTTILFAEVEINGYVHLSSKHDLIKSLLTVTSLPRNESVQNIVNYGRRKTFEIRTAFCWYKLLRNVRYTVISPSIAFKYSIETIGMTWALLSISKARANNSL